MLEHKKPALLIKAFSLSTQNTETLTRLAADLSALSGRQVSPSAACRALIAWAKGQPSSWIHTALLPEIEREIDAGRLWGGERTPKQRKKRSPRKLLFRICRK